MTNDLPHDDEVDDTSPLSPGDENPSVNTRNSMIMVGMVLLLVAVGVLYVGWSAGRASGNLEDREERAQAALDKFEASQRTPVPTLAPGEVSQGSPRQAEPDADAVSLVGPSPKPGEVLVVNRVPGDDYGRLAIRHADGSRTLIDRTCLRVHIAADRGVCLGDTGGVVPSFATTFFDPASPEVPIKAYASALPSRVRLSPSGRFSAVTAFLTGASYEDIEIGSTTIVTIDEIDETNRLTGLSQFGVEGTTDDKYDSQTAQFWGLTFADDNEFYITGFFKDSPEIMSGRLDDRMLEPTGWMGSCPSLSPDRKTLVFKELRPEGGFDLVAVDVASEKKWDLGESRSVDDQVEWLDNDTILYALHPDGGDTPVQPEFDIWMIDVAEGSEPELFLPNADSPAVSR